MIGGVICCAMFALSASRVNAVKFSFDGSEYHSSLDRNPVELSILAAHGRELQGMAFEFEDQLAGRDVVCVLDRGEDFLAGVGDVHAAILAPEQKTGP